MKPFLFVAVGGGVVSALFHLSVIAGTAGTLILAYLTPLPLFLVGLSVGGAATAIAGGLAVVLVAVADGGLMSSAVFLVTVALPVLLTVQRVLLARVATDGNTEWYPPGLTLLALVGYGVGGILVAAALSLEQSEGLKGTVQQFLTDGITEMVAASGSELAMAPGQGGGNAAQRLAALLAPVFPAMVAASWLVMTVVNGALAQGVLMRFGWNNRPAMPMADLELPGWVPLLLAASGGLAVVLPGTFGYVALNVALVLLVPFFFAGLAVVHAFARARSARVPIVVTVYLFVFLFGWPVLLVVGLGVIEQWIGLRQRFAGRMPDQED